MLPRFTAWIEGLGAWGPFVYVAAYVVATVALVPGSILTLTAGALFGLGKGLAVTFVGSAMGSALAFLVSRYVARARVVRWLAAHPRFQAIDHAIGEQGGRIVLLLRLSPVVPYNLLNYALGVTRVRFGPYVLASIGMVPAELLYVYYGKVAGDVLSLTGGGVPKGAAYYAVTIVGLAATIAATTIITRTAARELERRAGY